MNKRQTALQYWEDNIEKFSKFYYENSEEAILAPPLLSYLYKKIAFPIERKYMKVRYEMVRQFIIENVKENVTAADVGCGCGIFTQRMLALGAKVYALDFSKKALEATQKLNADADENQLEIVLFDVAKDKLPMVDVCLIMGVLPYVSQAADFFANTLPFTKKIIFNYLNAEHVLNRLRKALKFLDMRNYEYHQDDEIKNHLHSYNFVIEKSIPLATGCVIVAHRL